MIRHPLERQPRLKVSPCKGNFLAAPRAARPPAPPPLTLAVRKGL